jgi:putative colanic acid biosynthesis acetyltransferase WcaF
MLQQPFLNASMKVNLKSYDNSSYSPGSSGLKRLLWFYVNTMFINCAWMPVSSIKVSLLRLFGARIGNDVVIKPNVNIKYPWFLSIGNSVWIGEEVWIDNLTEVSISDNCCLSQGAMLLTGNHNFTLPTFDLIVQKIVLEEGAWVGAKAVVCPGITCKSHSVLAVGSVATKDLEANGIYQGNPATFVKERIITMALNSVAGIAAESPVEKNSEFNR